jgi:hypothetical protein
MLKGYHHSTTTSSSNSFFGMDSLWDERALALEQKIFENNKKAQEAYLANCIADIKAKKTLVFVQRKYQSKLGFDEINNLFKEHAPDPEQSMKDKKEQIEKAIEALEDDPLLDQKDEYPSDRHYLKAILSNDLYMVIPNWKLAALTGIGQTSIVQAKKDFMSELVLSETGSDRGLKRDKPEEMEKEAKIYELHLDQRFAPQRFTSSQARARAVLQCPEYADMSAYAIAKALNCHETSVAQAKEQLTQKQEEEKDMNDTKKNNESVSSKMLASDISRENWINRLSSDPRFKSHLFKHATARVRAILQSGDYKGMRGCDIAKVCNCVDALVHKVQREMRAEREKENPGMTREQYIAKLSVDQRFAPENFSSNAARIRAIAQSEDYKNMRQADIAIVCRCTGAHVATALASIHREKRPTINLDSAFNTPYQFTAPTELEDEPEDELDQEEDELDQEEDELEDELVNDQDELDQDEPQTTEKDEALAFWGIVPKAVENEPMQSESQLVLDKHTKKLFRRVLAKRIAKLKTKLEKLEKLYTDLN